MSNEWNLNKDMRQILESLVTSNDISKLIKYDVKNPLEQPNLSDPFSLIDDRVFSFSFIPNVQTEAKTFLTVSFSYIPKRGNSNYKVEEIMLRLLVHKSLVSVNYGSRVLSLVPLISETMTSVDIGIGALRHEYAREMIFSTDIPFTGYEFKFTTHEFDK